MSQSIQVNGQIINYPEIGDSNWGVNATNFAIETSAALGKIGLSSGTSVDITQTLDVTGNTTLDANLSVGGDASVTGNTTLTGNLTVNGNTQLGNANTDTIGVTGIVNIDSGVLYVDPVNNRVGINDTTPSQALDVTGNVAITGNETVNGTLGVTGDVAINTNKFNIIASSGNTTIAGTLGVTGNTTIDGVIYADDNTTANTPVISFTGDTNTGIGRSATDTIDFITNGNSRFRIESTGQIKAVYESTIGTDYNTRLDNGYLCRTWVNFDGTLSNTTGTYTRSGTTITCTITSHGLTTGQTANLDFTTGGATDGIYVVTVTNANTFTVEDTVSGTITTSNVTMLSRMIRASGNVSSITDNSTGDYTVNFITNMPDTSYAAISSTSGTGTIGNNPSGNRWANVSVLSTSQLKILARNEINVAEDHNQLFIGIFR